MQTENMMEVEREFDLSAHLNVKFICATAYDALDDSIWMSGIADTGRYFVKIGLATDDVEVIDADVAKEINGLYVGRSGKIYISDIGRRHLAILNRDLALNTTVKADIRNVLETEDGEVLYSSGGTVTCLDQSFKKKWHVGFPSWVPEVFPISNGERKFIAATDGRTSVFEVSDEGELLSMRDVGPAWPRTGLMRGNSFSRSATIDHAFSGCRPNEIVLSHHYPIFHQIRHDVHCDHSIPLLVQVRWPDGLGAVRVPDLHIVERIDENRYAGVRFDAKGTVRSTLCILRTPSPMADLGAVLEGTQEWAKRGA